MIDIVEEKNTFTVDTKLRMWGYGEWIEELDYIHFLYKNIDCKIRRAGACEGDEEYCEGDEEYCEVFGGHLCGYVKVPEDHPYFCKCYSNMQIKVHGGLTYGFFDSNGWIGFDCAHLCDLVPFIEKSIMLRHCFYVGTPYKKSTSYKNMNFCIEQCKSIVDQLLDVNISTV
jgi:hypothetical protein